MWRLRRLWKEEWQTEKAEQLEDQEEEKSS